MFDRKNDNVCGINEPQLACKGVSAGYGGEHIVKDISVTIPAGKITALIGPNGCGKSTLLKVLGNQLKNEHGQVTLGERGLDSFSARDFARQVSFLPQQPVVPEGMTVRELIAFGRYPYTGAFASLSESDQQAIDEAAKLTSVEDFLGHSAMELSGGQKQRMWIAMTLAQETSIMLLDEPTTFLDPAHQLVILELVKSLNRQGRTIVMVVHDMAHAAKFSDHVVVMKEGKILEQGPTESTLDPSLIKKAFNISTLMVTDPETGRKLPIAYGIHK